RVAVYTHRDPDKVAAPWAGKRIHRAEDVLLHSFDAGFVDRMAGAIERRNTATLTRTEGRVYLELNDTSGESDVHTRNAA
ncbi:YaeQ family protein, partial [Streptomyces brasiliscabiei]|uniref:YaeQ family protein n=1 Tax=Streptomyces brasiliscabiei TaxID=2736302 RepID=UPI003014519A